MSTEATDMADPAGAPDPESSRTATVDAMPRSIAVVDDARYDELARDPASIALIDDRHALVVPYSRRPIANTELIDRVRTLIASSDQLAPGELLVRNPYEAASYERAAQAMEVFASSKYHAFATFAGMLGATRVEFEDARVDRSDRHWAADLRAKVLKIGAEAKAHRRIEEELRKRLQGTFRFAGGAVDIESAKQFLVRHNLAADPQLSGLLQMRGLPNPLTEYVMHLSGTREAATNLESAVELAAAKLPLGLSVGGSFSSTVKSVSSIEIKTHIVF